VCAICITENVFQVIIVASKIFASAVHWSVLVCSFFLLK